ncbi:hypothetical protein CAEBREN_13723 [Caenorhabditis brenneri]|uniref:SCP domain-containing protein n=1 Tax=Caenorhabditis brenneri TaxID=135651 RepID=G0MDC7_CAEBE|nr:hypothetical protein CAEBREN_13723 [Caenorhabditis brenneri]
MLNQIIGLLLIAITTVAMDSMPDEDQIEFIEDLNEIRRAAANVYNIQNMHELKYSKKLAVIAKKLAMREPNEWVNVEGFQEKWRCFYLKDYVDWHDDIDNFFNISKESEVDMQLKDNTVELLVPLQKEIGCWEKPVDENQDSEDDSQDSEDESQDSEENRKHKRDNENEIFSKYQVICVIGKQGSEDSWIELQDNPNKKCSPKYGNNHGLCISKEDNNQLVFIDQLNDLRREVAKDYGVKNMHELVFSRKLVEMAQDHINGKTIRCLEVDCRFTQFEEYDTYDLKSLVLIFMSSTAEMQQVKLLENDEKGYVQSLEHVIPLQTRIGCADKNSGSQPFKITCVFYPQHHLNSWFTSSGTPGSDCFKGYSNVDGLCVPNYKIAVKNDVKTTEQPEITIEKNNPKEASTVPTQDSVTTEAATAETAETLPPDGNSNGIPSITPSKITSAPFARPTTTESELDRLIAKYQREEQDGDLPSEEDEVEYEYSNSRQVSLLISVIIIMMWAF